MRNIRSVTLAVSMLFLSAFASANQIVLCKNETTGAVFTVTREQTINNLVYNINSRLTSILRSQGVAYVQALGKGNVSKDAQGNFYFAAAEAKGYSLDLVGEKGGMLFKYKNYADSAASNFFFNPGECRFN